MFSTTISAIRRGHWLIDQAWAQAHADLIVRTLKGERVEWGFTGEKLSAKDAKAAMPQRLNFMSSVISMGSADTSEDSVDVFSAKPYMSADRFPKGSVVVVDVIGPVLKYGDECSYGSVDQNNLISRLAMSKNIAGIILNVDSPGGQVDGTAMFANTIRQASKMKPVIGIVQDGMAASAACWLLCACQEAYVSEATSQVGSIGAYTTLYDLDKYMEAQGLPVHVIYAPQSTDKNKDYREALKGNYSLIENELKLLVDDFSKDVKAFRGARLKTDKENPFTGKMYNASAATKVGLIDGVKDMAGVVSRVQNLISLRNQNTN